MICWQSRMRTNGGDDSLHQKTRCLQSCCKMNLSFQNDLQLKVEMERGSASILWVNPLLCCAVVSFHVTQTLAKTNKKQNTRQLHSWT